MPHTLQGVTLVDNPKQVTETTANEATQSNMDMRLRWKWVEASVWTDNMLTALENGVKGGKWFSLIDKIYKPKALHAAWIRVKANGGASGVDRVSVRKFDLQAERHLFQLSEEIATGTFRPSGVKRVYIPKAEGKTRPLGIPAVRDRIVQGAIKQAIEPIFEKEFLNMSYGFRPGKGAKDALRQVDETIKAGFNWVVDADLQSYFDTIPHDRLMHKVEEKVADTRVLTMIRAFLEAKIMEEMKEWKPDRGTPQGGVLSPVLANIYLHDLDVLITQRGYKMVRYADDFVILTQSEDSAKQALELVRTWTKQNGLELHPDKTHVGNCMQFGQGFEFLGYRFEGGFRQVRKKSLDKFKDKIRELTKRTCGIAVTMVIAKLKPILRGWYNYFKHAHHWTFERIDGWIRRRLRSILRQQQKRPGRGRTKQDHIKWPNTYFANLGLYSMLQAWHQDMACQSR